MLHPWTRLAAIIAGILMATTFLAAPAAGAVAVDDYGSLLKCKYERMDDREFAYGALRRVVITPPTIFGERTTQVVGWRVFLNWYELDDLRGRLQTATAWAGYAPDFEPVKFDLNTNLGDEEFVTATIRMIWYADDGSKEKVVDHQIGSEYSYVNGKLRFHAFRGGCESELQLDFPN